MKQPEDGSRQKVALNRRKVRVYSVATMVFIVAAVGTVALFRDYGFWSLIP